MDYEGPDPADIRNIRALNRAYMSARPHNAASDSTEVLTDLQMQRLAMAPFLLFSLRERDDAYWEQILGDDPQADLLDTAASPAIHELQVAALGFLWQLSRQRPYVARLVSGASSGWCERVARLTLVHLLRLAAQRSDLIVPRFPDGDQVRDRLLQNGVSARRDLQDMSQQLALQAMLTRDQPAHWMSAAACRRSTPVRQVAEHGDVKGRIAKV